MTKLNITLAQIDIFWEDKCRNLEKVEKLIQKHSGKTDIVILPEMFTTGFSMNSHTLAEDISGETITKVKEWAKKYELAICGSFIAKEGASYYNRGFFIDNTNDFFYDKRHLFRMGGETNSFDSGKNKLIIEHKGFNICLLVCYDLRFPVWSRNINNEYDLLIYVASWPKSRIHAWKTLLTARAIENMCFVCGVNRVGKDGLNLIYNGASALIDAKGDLKTPDCTDQEYVETFEIDKKELNDFREKFPVWKDADPFEISMKD